jgi:hypothetical protein
MIPIAIRPVAAGDIDFVFDSWLRSYFHYLKTKTHFQERLEYWKDPLLDIQVFFPEHRRIIEKLDANVTIAVNPEDGDQIYGWICATHPNEEMVILHYCFVKQPFRHLEISKRLLTSALKDKSRVFYTHFTKAGGEFLLKGLGGAAIYNPYMMRVG